MASHISFSELKISRSCATTISVFVKRDYEEKDYNSPYSRHLILSDVEGNTMMAYISKDIAKNYNDSLKEGGYYMINNFAVFRAFVFSKITNMPTEICFLSETTCMLDCSMPPMKKYEFTDFDKVIDGSKYSSCPGVDLLGVVVKVSKPDIFHCPYLNRPPRKHMDFTLKDINGKELDCTAWGSLADEFELVWTNFRRRDMTLCALRSWRIDKLLGKYSIHSCGCASQIWLNPKYYEAYLAEESFKKAGNAILVDDPYEQDKSDDDYYR